MDLKELIPLTIAPHTNSLDGITLYEPVELALLDKLIHCPTLLNKKTDDWVGDKKQLEDYRANYRKLRVEVKYTRKATISYGRFLPDRALGLHNLRRELRHTLIGEWGQDVDIANAHPRMLEQITTLHGIPNHWLKTYCENREDWLRRVVVHWHLDQHPEVVEGKTKAREIAKELPLVLSYGGGIKRWRDNWKRGEYEIPDVPVLDLIASFKAEIRNIHQRIKDANPHLTQQIIADKTAGGEAEGTYNLNGSVCSYFLQEYECRILEHIYQHCLHSGYIKKGEVMLCADGIILNKKLYHDGIPAELERVIQEKTGFQLQVEPKPMNNAYTPTQIEKALDFKLLQNTHTTGYLADIFRILYSDKFIYTNGELRTYNGVYWKGEQDKTNSTLHNWVDSKFYYYLNAIIQKVIWVINDKLSRCSEEEAVILKKELETIKARQKECEQICRNIKKRTGLVSDIINKINNADIIWDDDPNLLVFNNKVYDLQQDKWVAPNYRDYNSITTGYNWDEYELAGKKATLLRLIDSIFPDKKIRDYYLTALATGLSGRQQENLFIATGVGGNGKSLLNGLMLTAMGRYGYKMPNWVLQDKIGTGACPELANLHNKRFVLTSEPDRKKKISTNTMKEITGDPTLNARQLYQNTMEGGVKLKLSLFLEANKLPILDEVGDGVGRRIDVFPFQSRFVSENDYNKMLETRSEEEIRQAHIYRGNPLYKEDEWKRDNTHALIAILLDYYRAFQLRGYSLGKAPKSCEEAKQDYLQASDDLYGWFENEYRKADDDHPEEIMKLADIYADFKHSVYFSKLPSKEQNKNTKKYFTTELNDNINLRMYIRKRDTRYQGLYYKSDYLIGWRKKGQEYTAGGGEEDLTDEEEGTI